MNSISYEGNQTWIGLWRMCKIWIDEDEWIGHGGESNLCLETLCMASKLDKRINTEESWEVE